MNALHIYLEGEPVPKARPRVYGGRAYTTKRTKEAERALGWAAKESYPGLQPDATTKFRVIATFACGDLPESQRPDGDNLLKLALDALTGIVWWDDRQARRYDVSVDYAQPVPATWLTITPMFPQPKD